MKRSSFQHKKKMALYSQSSYWYFGLTLDISACFIAISLTILHTKNVFQDLFTKSRNSVAHRATKPEINSMYRIIALCINISIIFYAINLISSICSSTIITNAWNSCNESASFGSFVYYFAKMFMYLGLCIYIKQTP